MKFELDTLLENNIIDSGKVTELYVDGKSVWKGLSDNVSSLAENYSFINFNKDVTHEFNEATYKINVSPKKSKTLVESRLPKSDSVDPEFGLPEEKKFPLFDKSHVESAVRFFNYVKGKDREEKLAKAIIAKMEKYNIPFSMVGDDNRLKKYLPVQALKEEPLYDKDGYEIVKMNGKSFETKQEADDALERGDLMKTTNPNSKNKTILGPASNVGKDPKDYTYTAANSKSMTEHKPEWVDKKTSESIKAGAIKNYFLNRKKIEKENKNK